MLAAIRSRLTYANAMATIAVLIALGAGGYAVGAVPDSKGRIPACYVAKGKQKGELRVLVTGTKCRRAERKLVWNRRGIQGAQGVAGPRGPQGVPGPAGPSEAANQGLFPGGPGLLLSAGGYYVQAIVQANNTAGGTAAEFNCTLTIGSARDIKTTTVAAGGTGVLTLHQIHTLAASGNANVTCTGLSSWNGLIVAMKVGTVREI